ncbi:MAG: YaeQ family protein [Deltaproteobacteria bacterium]|nr:YaeQ family protein [Deltaproteobacteria bacterium]
MALKATISKVNLSVSNIDRHHYQDYRLTLAQHPSETDLRLVFRLAAFALYSQENPQFTKGLCADEEPELWTHRPTGEIRHWIELGQPSEKRIRQALSKAERMTVIGFHSTKFKMWFKGLNKKTLEQKKLRLIMFESIGTSGPEDLAQKNMNLSCIIQDDRIFLSSENVQVTLAISSPVL